MKTILEEIDEIKKDMEFAERQDRKKAFRSLLDSLWSLINARSLLPEGYIDNIVGFKTQGYNEYKNGKKIIHGLSYLQIYNCVVHYIKTGHLYKKMWHAENMVKLYY